MRLPVVVRHNAGSHELVTRLKAGIVLPLTIDFSFLDSQLKEPFEPQVEPALFWEPDGEKIINALNIK
jgi:hypothetical protein